MAEIYDLNNKIQQNTVDFISKQLQTYIDFLFGADTDNSETTVEGLPLFACGETGTSVAMFLFPNIPSDISEYQGYFEGAYVGNFSIAPNIPPENWVNFSFSAEHSYHPTWISDETILNKIFDFMSLNEDTLYNVEHTANWTGDVYPVYTRGSGDIVVSNEYGITTLLTGSDPLNRYNFTGVVLRPANPLPLSWNARNLQNLWSQPNYAIYNYGNLPKISTQSDPTYINYVQNLPDIQTYEYTLKSGDIVNVYYNDNTVVLPVSKYYDDLTDTFKNDISVTYDDIYNIFTDVLPTDVHFKTYKENKGEDDTFYINPINKISYDFDIDTQNYLDNSVLSDTSIFIDVANWYFDIFDTLGISTLLCFVVLSCLILRKL